MEVRPGYKQTEVGAIPEDWEVRRLGNIANIKTGGRNNEDKTEDGLYPFFVRSEYVERINSHSYDCEAILVPGEGRIGEIFHYINGKFDVHQRVYAITQFSKDVSPKYIYLCMSMNFGSWAMQNTVKATVDSLRLPTFQNFELYLPASVEEQHVIAAALSDMDALLDGLDHLIAKKRAIKQATMQQLLTGQTRLPGFSGEWEVRLLGDIAHIKTGSRNNEDKIENGEYPFFVRSANVERINSYSYDCEAILVPGEGQIGNIFHYVKGRFDVHQRVYAITQFANEISGRYVHLYMTQNFGDWAMQNTVKATVDSLRLPTFLNFEVGFPPSAAEQTAIAAVLSDMDTEITALEARRLKTRAIKQAMMQELLTGRTRLVEPDAKQPIEKEVAQAEGRKANVYFLRSVLAAEIIDQLHDQPTFGHVKFEKMMFLVEHLCDVDTGSTYHRKAAGPYDNRALRSIDSQLQKQQWFGVRKEDGRYRYVPMAKRGDHKKYFDRHFSNIGETVKNILAIFKTAKTEQCEIVATLLAAWNDLLREKVAVSDEVIVHEVLNNWHESKQRIPEDRWLKALVWMREKGFVPKGVISP